MHANARKIEDQITGSISGLVLALHYDPLSPLLFHFVVDALANILETAKSNGVIHGLVPHLVPVSLPALILLGPAPG